MHACAKARIESLGLATRWLASTDKLAALEQASTDLGIAFAHICFVGDGREDAVIMRSVGLGVAVADAHPDALAAAAHVATRRGGDRALEEIVDAIARAQGWAS